jgi:hypothetical protein
MEEMYDGRQGMETQKAIKANSDLNNDVGVKVLQF